MVPLICLRLMRPNILKGKSEEMSPLRVSASTRVLVVAGRSIVIPPFTVLKESESGQFASPSLALSLATTSFGVPLGAQNPMIRCCRSGKRR